MQDLSSPLSHLILTNFNELSAQIKNQSQEDRLIKKFTFTGKELVSVADIIAYQIGWGRRVIEWYELGLKGKKFTMPGDGFNKWQYEAIAAHFYKTYHYDGFKKQYKTFLATVTRLVEIVEEAYENENLDEIDIWPWTKLQTGKSWPLSKWILVNTVDPYKRATLTLKGINNSPKNDFLMIS